MRRQPAEPVLRDRRDDERVLVDRRRIELARVERGRRLSRLGLVVKAHTID